MSQRILSINGIPVVADVSDTEELRQYGLMNRGSLADGNGMLFIFPEEGNLSFWMKNTKIPLSIAYISKSGKILNIEDMQPYDLNSSYSSGLAQYALEVPLGWFKRKRISPGDQVDGVSNSKNICLMKESEVRSLIKKRLL